MNDGLAVFHFLAPLSANTTVFNSNSVSCSHILYVGFKDLSPGFWDSIKGRVEDLIHEYPTTFMDSRAYSYRPDKEVLWFTLLFHTPWEQGVWLSQIAKVLDAY
jgi:hypothetical protein